MERASIVLVDDQHGRLQVRDCLEGIRLPRVELREFLLTNGSCRIQRLSVLRNLRLQLLHHVFRQTNDLVNGLELW